MKPRLTRAFFVVAAALSMSCSSGNVAVMADLATGDASDGQSADELSGAEVLDARPLQELAAAETYDFLSVDLVPDAPFVECEPGQGCFLDPCTDNGDCLSGWCVEHLGDSVCSVTCQEECPPGWSCSQVGTGPDVGYVCVSKVANLCRPCATGSDCKSPGGAEDVCVDYEAEGSFCGGSCGVDEDCPWGFSCLTTLTIDGISTLQCVAEAGVCPCSSKSVQLSLSTPCEVVSEWGECQGLRTCTEAGLSDCDAPAPAEELCDGIDSDCDGMVDEAKDIGGDSVNLCNDDNPCTKDMCNGESGCSYEDLDGGECLDGDACTVGDHCEAGTCLGLPIACDDGDPCTDDMCDGLGGCLSEHNTEACDDGDPCSVADSCSDGKCAGTIIPCDCQADSDCDALEDGDLCNGTLFCDLDNWPYKCAVAPGTVVFCPEPEAGPDAVCLQTFCDPVTGQCEMLPDHAGYACDDADACTVGDQCVEGICTGGVPAGCQDENPCTDDSCDPGIGCVHTPNQAPCNDGDVCTTTDTCADGACAGGPALVCDDANVCNGTESCDSQVGCKAGGPLVCDDGNLCNGIESCDPIVGCLAGAPLACDDGEVCTEDSCDPANGCVHAANIAPCDDGNSCTTGDVCAAGKCLAGNSLDCDDDNICTTDKCAPAQGCVHLLNQVPCDDGDICTLSDYCHLGECASDGELNCDDSNGCTLDGCDPAIGCQFVPTAEACDDGNACTAGDHCALGSCVSDGILDCDDNSVCTKDFCLADSGCGHTPLEGPCSDGTACTVDDVCADGICVPGVPLGCDDGNQCTTDLCDVALGCVHVAVVGGCDDGAPCTVTDQCVGTVCTAGPPKDCDDDNVCTKDACNVVGECEHTALAGACDDGDSCTEGETCTGGLCQGGQPVDCDDGSQCTEDSCDDEKGCLHVPFAPCCGNGILEPGEECDDGNEVGGDGCEADCTEFSAVNVTFSTCGGTGPGGPSQGQCNNTYSGQPFLNGKVTVSSGIQSWAVPFTGTYRIETWAARGGCNGGNGARMRGDFQLTKGTTLKILVGQMGLCAGAQVGNGGGGGTFVAKDGNTPLVVAGGGGGTGHNSYANYDMAGKTSINGVGGKYAGAGAGGTNGGGGGVSHTTGNGTPNGGGGGGFNGDGGSDGHAHGGKAFVNGGGGGTTTGGFGGGGGSDYFKYGCGSSPHGGSGGGGYSGGGAGGDNCNGPGGGAGSYNNGANQSNSSGANSTHGKVTIIRQ